MNSFKKITIFRLYVLLCILTLSGFTYAEYFGYEILGSDESGSTSHVHGTGGGSSAHHK